MGALRAQYGLEAGMQVLAAAALAAGLVFLAIVLGQSQKVVQA